MQIKKNPSGLIIVVSAPSGTGKTTLCQKLAEKNKKVMFSISYTTRSPRPEEKNGKDYFFITWEEFLKKREEGFFAEWAEVHHALYGTSRESLDGAINRGKDIVLTIDTQGAFQIKEKYPEAISVFVFPPTFEDLKKRLRKRKTESEEEIEKRLRQAKKEIEISGSYDYTITNRTLEEALHELEAILTIEKAKLKEEQRYSS